MNHARPQATMRPSIVSDQVIAATVDYERLLREAARDGLLKGRDKAFDSAMREIQRIEAFVGTPSSILGNDRTKHGEIAEQVTVGVRRARAALDGLPKKALDSVATFKGVGRTAPEDYLMGGVQVQSKYINGTNRSLDSILEHLDKYPQFGEKGHIYHIPRDQYDQLETLYRAGPARAGGQGGPSLRSLQATQRKLEALENRTGRSFKELIAPGEATYSEVQQGKIHDTLDARRDELSKEHDARRNSIVEEHRPSLQGAAVAAAAGGAIGATMRVAPMVWTKMRQGKNPFQGQFETEDWEDLGLCALKGGVQGAVTGGAVYAMTNLARLSAPMAGAVVSCTSSVLALHSQYRRGEIDQEEFVTLSMVASLDVSMSMVGGAMGQVLIPIPVVGALLGSLGAKFVSSILKKYASDSERELGKRFDVYVSWRVDLLTAEARRRHASAMHQMNDLDQLITHAFSPDLNIEMRLAFSVDIARKMGLPEREILHDLDEIDAFFLE